MTNFYLSESKGEGLFQQPDFEGFHPFSSPKHDSFLNDMNEPDSNAYAGTKPDNVGINELFNFKRTSSDNEKYKFDFEEPQKLSHKMNSYEFFSEEDPKFEPFKQPRKKSDSDSDNGTGENHSNVKNPFKQATREHTQTCTMDTKSGVSTQSMKSGGVFDAYSCFNDLNPAIEKEVPTLNHMVSLTMADGDYSFSVKTSSSRVSDCKLLNNFLNMAESSDLADLDRFLDLARDEISAKLSKLPGQ